MIGEDVVENFREMIRAVGGGGIVHHTDHFRVQGFMEQNVHAFGNGNEIRIVYRVSAD